MSLSRSNDPKAGPTRESTGAEFHTYPGGLGLDSDGYFLLAHTDSAVDLAVLSERHSRLGLFDRIEEVRSDAPILCAIGRDPQDAVVFRSTLLTEDAKQRAEADVLQEAASTWPDLELLGFHAHLEEGSCFLLRGTADNHSDG